MSIQIRHVSKQFGSFRALSDLSLDIETGELVTDDNQLLQFSQLRAGLRVRRYRELTFENQRILTEIAGHIPFQLDRNAFARPRR